MDINFTLDQFLDIINYYNGEPNNLSDIEKSIADNELAIVMEYFEGVIDQDAFMTMDYVRLRLFFIHWYAAYRTLLYFHKNLSDIRYINKQLLLESFGYFFHYLNSDTSQQMLMYNLNKFYAYNGTPDTIINIIESVDILGFKLVEYLITMYGDDHLQFTPQSAFLRDQLSPQEVSAFSLSFDEVTRADPHWILTEEEILNMVESGEETLPIMTPYFGLVQMVDWYTDVRRVVLKLKRMVRHQTENWINTGILPDEIYIDGLDDMVSLLELYCAFVYAYKLYFNESFTDDNTNQTLEETQLPINDVIDNAIYIDEFDRVYVERVSTREERRQVLADRLSNWTTGSPNDYPYNTVNDYKNTLMIVNNDFYNYINNNISYDLLKYLLNRLEYYSLVYFDLDVPLRYMIYDDTINEDILSLVNYFKPYPSRLILFKTIFVINDLPGDQLIIEDELKNTKIKMLFNEYVGFILPSYLLGGNNHMYSQFDFTVKDIIFERHKLLFTDRYTFLSPVTEPRMYHLFDLTVKEFMKFNLLISDIEHVELNELVVKNISFHIEEHSGFSPYSQFDYFIVDRIFYSLTKKFVDNTIFIDESNILKTISTNLKVYQGKHEDINITITDI